MTLTLWYCKVPEHIARDKTCRMWTFSQRLMTTLTAKTQQRTGWRFWARGLRRRRTLYRDWQVSHGKGGKAQPMCSCMYVYVFEYPWYVAWGEGGRLYRDWQVSHEHAKCIEQQHLTHTVSYRVRNIHSSDKHILHVEQERLQVNLNITPNSLKKSAFSSSCLWWLWHVLSYHSQFGERVPAHGGSKRRSQQTPESKRPNMTQTWPTGTTMTTKKLQRLRSVIRTVDSTCVWKVPEDSVKREGRHALPCLRTQTLVKCTPKLSRL